MEKSKTNHTHLSFKNAVSCVDLSARTKILVQGSDRIDFLHRLLTQEIKSVPVGQGAYGAMLTATGKTLFDALVFIQPDSILLDAETNLTQKILAILNKFVISEDIQLTEVSQNWIHLGFRGLKAKLFFEEVFGWKSEGSANIQHQTISWKSFSLTIIEAHTENHPVYQILIPREQSSAFETIIKAGQPYGLVKIDQETAEQLRIENRELRYGIDFGEENVLPETGLEDRLVSETKGCYPGQEVVAKIKTYGGLHRKITALVFSKENIAKPGDKVYATINDSTQEVGQITSAAFSPTLDKNIALALLQTKGISKDTSFKIATPDSQNPGKFLESI